MAGRNSSTRSNRASRGSTETFASEVINGGAIELEQRHSTGPSLDVDRLHARRHRQHRGDDADATRAVDRHAGADPADRAAGYGTLSVRPALCRQTARRTGYNLI